MISNFLIPAVILLFVLLGIWRGAAKTLLNLAALAVSSVIAHLLSSAIAEAVYNHFIRQTVISNLEGCITQQGEQFAAQNSVQALPEGMQSLLGSFTGLFGVSPEQVQGRLVPSTQQTSQLAQAIEKPLGDLCVCVLTVLLSFVLFFIFMIVFKLVIRFVLGFFRLPFIRQVNKILGGVLGVVEGLLFAFVLVNVIYVVLSYTNPLLLENSGIFGGVFHALTIFK